jgi:hypothetical protein
LQYSPIDIGISSNLSKYKVTQTTPFDLLPEKGVDGVDRLFDSESFDD